MPAKSEKQKKFFGAVMGAKSGQKGVTGAAKKAAKGMSKETIKHFLKKESYNFKEFFTIWEMKCWKGYRKVGTKKGKNGKRVNDCVKINEAYKLSSSFMELPDSPPHGFWITKDGKFIVVGRMFGHDEALKELFPDLIKGKQGVAALQSAMKNGMIRVAKMGDNYGLTYHPMYMTSGAAKKTAKDIAEFYNMGIVDDFEGL